MIRRQIVVKMLEGLARYVSATTVTVAVATISVLYILYKQKNKTVVNQVSKMKSKFNVCNKCLRTLCMWLSEAVPGSTQEETSEEEDYKVQGGSR